MKKYENVEIATRDRASSYGSAIKGALPNANQIADYAHLLMNLTDKGKEYIREEIPSKIYFTDKYIITKNIKEKVYTISRSKIEISPAWVPLTLDNG